MRLGLKPETASASPASISATSDPLSSTEPRPHTASPARAPEKGGCFHAPSVAGSTGTTSWCAIRITGASKESLPGQVQTRAAVPGTSWRVVAAEKCG